MKEFIKNEAAKMVVNIIRQMEKDKTPVAKDDMSQAMIALNEYEKLAKTKVLTSQELRIVFMVINDLRSQLER